jgi:hypothetical protein
VHYVHVTRLQRSSRRKNGTRARKKRPTAECTQASVSLAISRSLSLSLSLSLSNSLVHAMQLAFCIYLSASPPISIRRSPVFSLSGLTFDAFNLSNLPQFASLSLSLSLARAHTRSHADTQTLIIRELAPVASLYPSRASGPMQTTSNELAGLYCLCMI